MVEVTVTLKNTNTGYSLRQMKTLSKQGENATNENMIRQWKEFT